MWAYNDLSCQWLAMTPNNALERTREAWAASGRGTDRGRPLNSVVRYFLSHAAGLYHASDRADCGALDEHHRKGRTPGCTPRRERTLRRRRSRRSEWALGTCAGFHQRPYLSFSRVRVVCATGGQ